VKTEGALTPDLHRASLETDCVPEGNGNDGGRREERRGRERECFLKPVNMR
jgi:hypothetical protein